MRVEGRAALHFFEKDLSSRVRGRLLQRENEPKETDAANDELGFLCYQNSAGQETGKNGGEVCFARYYTAITPDESGKVSRKLFRQFVSSADVFPEIPEDPRQLFEPPEKDAGRDEIVAYDVAQFKLTYFVQNASGEWLNEEKWLATQSNLPETERREFSPSLLKVSLSLVDRASAHRLPRAADWEKAAAFIDSAEFPQKIKISTFQTQISLK